MNAIYPDDADGDALRKVASLGADMSKPMTLEFTIAVPTIGGARALVERIAAIGYRPELFVDDSDDSVSLPCARSMIAT